MELPNNLAYENAHFLNLNPAWLQENSISVMFSEALLSLRLCKSPWDLCNLEHSGRDPPISRPPWTVPAYLEGGISASLEPCVREHRRFLSRPGASVPSVRTLSAQPTVVPIRGPACSTFLELIKFLCPILPILRGSSPKFLLSSLPTKSYLSQPLKPHPLSDNSTLVLGVGRYWFKGAWQRLLLPTFLG